MSAPDEQVMRVAQAIAQVERRMWVSGGLTAGPEWDDLSRDGRDQYVTLARAAIRAMSGEGSETPCAP